MIKLSRIAIAAALAAASTTAYAIDLAIDGVDGANTPDAEKDWSGMIGLALLSKPEYIGSEDTEGTGAPIIIVDYKDTAYFNVNRAGYWFWKPNENFRAGAVIAIREGAWEEDDDSIEDIDDKTPLPAGFDEPDPQAEPGVNALYKNGDFKVEARLTSGEDVNLKVDFDYNLIANKEHLLFVRVGIEQLGEDTVKYNWYGDDSSYDNDSATNTSLGLIGLYTLNPSWKLLYGATATSLDDEIDDSPIVEEDTYNIAFVGALWVF